MDQKTYIITFDNVSPGDANHYAEELRNALLDATADIVVDRRRDNPRSQDFGGTLVIILGAPAITVAIKTIGEWLKQRMSASITVKTSDQQIIVQNITSKNATELAKLFLKKE